MRFEKPSTPPNEREPHLDNEDEVTRILETGTDEEMEQLKQHIERRHQMTIPQERMERGRQFARQRRRLIERSNAETKERLATHPEATELEYAVGAYQERLETPVRGAVFALRQKGYASYESGFSGMEAQRISFMLPIHELETHQFSEQTKALFDAAEAEPSVTEKAIGFTMGRLLSDEELASLWNALISELPALEPAQEMTSIPTAVGFRKKQDAHFRKEKS